jgi:hypothetical protein
MTAAIVGGTFLLALIACLVAARAGVLVIHFRKPPQPRQRQATPPEEAKP